MLSINVDHVILLSRVVLVALASTRGNARTKCYCKNHKSVKRKKKYDGGGEIGMHVGSSCLIESYHGEWVEELNILYSN
jgi:hypothetical protein